MDGSFLSCSDIASKTSVALTPLVGRQNSFFAITDCMTGIESKKPAIYPRQQATIQKSNLKILWLLFVVDYELTHSQKLRS